MIVLIYLSLESLYCFSNSLSVGCLFIFRIKELDIINANKIIKVIKIKIAIIRFFVINKIPPLSFKSNEIYDDFYLIHFYSLEIIAHFFLFVKKNHQIFHNCFFANRIMLIMLSFYCKWEISDFAINLVFTIYYCLSYNFSILYSGQVLNILIHKHLFLW